MSKYIERQRQQERRNAQIHQLNVAKRNAQQQGLSGGGVAVARTKTKIKKKTNPYRLGDY